jgi:hypothetical protein
MSNPKIKGMKIAIDGNPKNTIDLPCTKEKFNEKVGRKLLAFEKVGLAYIISLDDNKWHLSISTRSRIPNYAEMKFARYAYLPDEVHMAQIFPPQAEFVNLQKNTLHLFEIER